MSELERDAVVQRVVQRLERLERENRTLKRVGAAALAVVLIAGLTAQASRGGHTLAAERFVLRDAQGVEHGALAITPDGTAQLHLGTEDGASVARLAVAPTGYASLSLSGNYQVSAPAVRLDMSPGDFTGVSVEVGGAGGGISLGGSLGQPAAIEWTPMGAQFSRALRVSSPDGLDLVRSDLNGRSFGKTP